MIKLAVLLATAFFLAACATQDQIYRYNPTPGTGHTCQTGGIGCG